MGSLIRNAFLSQLAHRGNFLGYLFLLLAAYGMRLAYIDGVFHYTGEVGGWGRSEVTFVLYLAVVVTLAVDTFDTSLIQFYRLMALGQIEPFLTKPVPFVQVMLFRWCKPANLILLAGVLLFWPCL